MRKLLLPVLFVLVMFQACQKEPIPVIPEEEEEVYVPSQRVEGRVALAYVTYWGTATPDPRLFTHISYAFAELYVKNGVYEGFKLQGKEERFRQIVNLKQQFPHLKILISFTHVVDNSDNSQGGSFSALAKSDEYRKAFAND